MVKNKNFNKIIDICFIAFLTALIFFLSFSKVGDYIFASTFYTSPFLVKDVRFILSYIALMLTIISLIFCISSIWFNQKWVIVTKHISIFLSIILLLIAFIFNITYKLSFVHACSLLGIIFTGLLLVAQITYFISAIKNRSKKEVQ